MHGSQKCCGEVSELKFGCVAPQENNVVWFCLWMAGPLDVVQREKQDAQLSQRDRAAGYISFGRKWKNWETIFYWYYRSVFNHCNIIGQQSYRIRWKTQNKAISLHCSRSFKDIGIGTKRKPVGLCDFILVINSNWHPIALVGKPHSLIQQWIRCW